MTPTLVPVVLFLVGLFVGGGLLLIGLFVGFWMGSKP